MCTLCLAIVFVEAFINVFSGALTLAIFTRVVLSWIPDTDRLALARFVWHVSEPLLQPFRRLLRPIGGFDFSPFAAMLVIQGVSLVLLRVLPPAV